MIDFKSMTPRQFEQDYVEYVDGEPYAKSISYEHYLNVSESLGMGFDETCEYLCARARGESHNIAKMVATRKGPSLVTDDSFRAGTRNHAQFKQDGIVGKKRIAAAKRAGIDPTGKFYVSQLARFPNDPRAWVNGRGDVKAICEKEGWGCEGVVNTKARNDKPPVPDIEIDLRLVTEKVDDIMATNPDAGKREDVYERTYNLMSGKESLDKTVHAGREV